MLAQFEADGRTLDDARKELARILGEVDNSALYALTDQALEWAFTQGIVDGYR
jgi:hypothetical protein